MSGFFMLDDATSPVPAGSADAYFEWHSSMPDSDWWYVKKTGVGFQIAHDVHGDKCVSTVFLGMNHGFGDETLLFETMVFPDCDVCERYATYRDAVAGHVMVLKSLQQDGK